MRKNADTLQKIETRLRAQARDTDKNELVSLLVKMGQRDAESKFFRVRLYNFYVWSYLITTNLDMALVSNTALYEARLKKQESSLMKVQKYEQIADKLISSADLKGEKNEFFIFISKNYRGRSREAKKRVQVYQKSAQISSNAIKTTRSRLVEFDDS